MFYLRYIWSELRRRRGRTIFTALGLGVGVGLVVTVSALSSGLDRAQSKVLEPLTGVGTDMSVTRPIQITGSGDNQSFAPGAGPAALQEGAARIAPRERRRPIRPQQARQSRPALLDDDLHDHQPSFPAKEAKRIDAIDGVAGSSGGLTLNMIHLEGSVPDNSSQSQSGFGAPPDGAGGPGGNVNFQPITVSGVDTANSDIGLITPSQITKGDYLGTGQVSGSCSHRPTPTRRTFLSAITSRWATRSSRSSASQRRRSAAPHRTSMSRSRCCKVLRPSGSDQHPPGAGDQLRRRCLGGRAPSSRASTAPGRPPRRTWPSAFRAPWSTPGTSPQSSEPLWPSSPWRRRS